MNPFNDEKMTFCNGRYYLTEEAMVANGTNMRARLSYCRATDATNIINRHLHHVTDMIYNYIHSFSTHNSAQDELIATVPALRNIIFEAMLNQSEYVLLNGDWSRSPELDKRKFAIDETAKQILNTVIPDIGVPITYIGG